MTAMKRKTKTFEPSYRLWWNERMPFCSVVFVSPWGCSHRAESRPGQELLFAWHQGARLRQVLPEHISINSQKQSVTFPSPTVPRSLALMKNFSIMSKRSSTLFSRSLSMTNFPIPAVSFSLSVSGSGAQSSSSSMSSLDCNHIWSCTLIVGTYAI